MKKAFLLSILLFNCTIIICKSQISTTWDDYNYITKGISDDRSHGKPIKAGYNIGNQIAQKSTI